MGTNHCRISVHAAAPGRVVVFSALNNLGKGAAGQIIQNLNLAEHAPAALRACEDLLWNGRAVAVAASFA